jgi:hypothetical protein
VSSEAAFGFASGALAGEVVAGAGGAGLGGCFCESLDDPGARFSLGELAALGVKRVSVGSALARASFGALIDAAREMREHGTFAFADHAVAYRELGAMFDAPVMSSQRK